MMEFVGIYSFIEKKIAKNKTKYRPYNHNKIRSSVNKHQSNNELLQILDSDWLLYC